MNDNNGECDFATFSYSGSVAPFDEELSIHLRGPLYLKQFAFYTPSGSAAKARRNAHVNKHVRDAHKRAVVADNVEIEERATSLTCPGSNSTSYTSNGKTFTIECGFDRPGNIGMVYTTTFSDCVDQCAAKASCVDVSYLANSGGACYMKSSILAPNYNANIYGAKLAASQSSSVKSSTSTSKSSSATSTSKTTSSLTSSSKATSSSTTSTKPTSSSSKSSSTSSSSTPPAATGGSWTRQSYYSSTAGTAQNVVFLNTMGGGTVSGVWSSYFGNSLSYSSSDGTKAASSAQVLSDMTLASSTEIALFSGTSCSSGSGCGYYRPGIPAYHGFGGASKIFVFEFSMPNDASGDNQPAIWMLNALIPRTQQYGSCTCWGNTNGCGELDIFEVLTKGETRMTSSIHGNQASGDSDYFAGPMSGTIKAAIVLDNQRFHIKILNSAFNIGSTLSATDYANLVASTNPYVPGGNVSTVTLS
ncbi:hypothetical protein AAFC00_002731 [Neodothiora populina]